MSGPAPLVRHSMPMTRPLIGIGLLYLSTWFLSLLDATGKWVMALGVSLIFMTWVRYLVHLLIVATLFLPSHGLSIFQSKQPMMQILRGIVMFVSTLSFFTALSYLPQAEATAIVFLAPLIMLIAAPWVLNEQPRRSRWVAALFGFIGVLIVIRPSSGLSMVGVAFGLLTAFLFAAQHTLTRKIASDNAPTTLMWSGVVGTVLLTLAVPLVWESSKPALEGLTPTQWLIMISLGFSGGMGHLLQISAYRNAPASMLAPFIYLQITAAATIGWLIWGHFPDAVTWIGIGIICASGIGIGWVEWRRSAKAQLLRS